MNTLEMTPREAYQTGRQEAFIEIIYKLTTQARLMDERYREGTAERCLHEKSNVVIQMAEMLEEQRSEEENGGATN